MFIAYCAPIVEKVATHVAAKVSHKKDPNLQKAIEAFMEYSGAVQSDIAELIQSFETEGIARAGLLPHISFEAGHDFSHTSKPGVPPRKQTSTVKNSSGSDSTLETDVTGDPDRTWGPQNHVKFQAVYNLFNGGKSTSEFKRVNADIAAKSYEYYVKLMKNLVDFFQDIADIESYKKRIEFSKKDLQGKEKIMQGLDVEKKEGAGSIKDYETIKSRFAEGKITLTREQSALEDKKKSFAEKTGNVLLNDDIQLSLPQELPKDFDSAYRKALAQNPTIRAYEHKVRAAEYQRDMAKSEFFPNVDFDASIRTNDTPHTDRRIPNGDREQYGRDHRTDARIGITLTWSLFNGGKDFYGHKKEVKGVIKAKKDLIQARQELAVNLKKAWDEFESRKENQKSHDMATEALTRSYQSLESEYKEGVSSLRDLLEEEQRLLEAQKSSADNHAQLVVKAWEIKSYMGELRPELFSNKKYFNPFAKGGQIHA